METEKVGIYHLCLNLEAAERIKKDYDKGVGVTAVIEQTKKGIVVLAALEEDFRELAVAEPIT